MYATLFAHVLRREFFHSSALIDWKQKIQLLDVTVVGLRNLVDSERLNLTLPQFDVSVHMANLAKRLVNAADQHIDRNIPAGQVFGWLGRDEYQRSVTAVNMALSETSRLAVLLELWQAQLGENGLADELTIPVPRGWDPDLLLQRALDDVHLGLKRDDNAIDLCIKTRHLFLVNYFRATIDLNSWTEADNAEVLNLHGKVGDRVLRIQHDAEKRGYQAETPLIHECLESIKWRFECLALDCSRDRWARMSKTIRREFRLLHLADRPVNPLANMAQDASPRFKVWLFGSEAWQSEAGRSMAGVVDVPPRRAFHGNNTPPDLVLVEGTAANGGMIAELRDMNTRVVVQAHDSSPSHRGCIVDDGEPFDVHRVIAHIFLSRDSVGEHEQSYLNAVDAVARRLRRHAATNSACHTLDQLNQAEVERNWPAQPFSHLRDVSAQKDRLAGLPSYDTDLAEEQVVPDDAFRDDVLRQANDVTLRLHGFSSGTLPRALRST